jgi:hypothetical protein
MWDKKVFGRSAFRPPAQLSIGVGSDMVKASHMPRRGAIDVSFAGASAA